MIIPTYNRALTVAEAVSSALLQSVPPAEIIVVDDGSTDPTQAILHDRFAPAIKTGQLRIISGTHAGVSRTRNLGLEAAQGDIIAYLDSDNLWEVDHLLWGRMALALAPEGAQMAYTAASRHNIGAGWSDVLHNPFDAAALQEANTIDLNVVLHPRSSFETLGGFDSNLRRLVDWDLALRYTRNAPPGQLPVITSHNFLEPNILGNITFTEDLESNAAHIRAKGQSDMVPR